MGIGSYLVLLNATPWPWNLTYIHSYQMTHWDTSMPATVNPGEDFQIYVEQDDNILDNAGDDAGEATYTFQNWDGDTAPSFQVQYREGDDGPEVFVDFQTLSTVNNAAGETLQLQWSQNRNSPFIVASSFDTSTTELVSSNPPEDWMHQTYDRISCLTLRELCMPGTHDSGMSEFNAHTIDAQAFDTVTQYEGIGDQLINGARWFDIRPVISGGAFATGHYSFVDTVGWQGGNGQSMDDIIDQVNSFTNANQELVILSLTHGLDTDIFGSDPNGYHFTQDNWNSLLNDLLAINYRVPNMADVSDVTTTPLSSFIASNPAVLIVVSDQVDEDGTAVDLGDFANQGFFTGDQLMIYNSFADSNDNSDIESDQIDKMNQVRTSPDAEMFLLSWTSTWAANTLFTSITDLADSVNNDLWTNLWGNLDSNTYPNIIAVDAYTSTSRPFPALAMAINYYLAPTCTAAAISASAPPSSVPPSSVASSSVGPSSIASSSVRSSGIASSRVGSSGGVSSSIAPGSVVSSSASSVFVPPSSIGSGSAIASGVASSAVSPASGQQSIAQSSSLTVSVVASSSSSHSVAIVPVSTSGAARRVNRVSDMIMKLFDE